LRWKLKHCLDAKGQALSSKNSFGGYLCVKNSWYACGAFCWIHKVGDWNYGCVLSIKVKTHSAEPKAF
jgi:hypothetical protein